MNTVQDQRRFGNNILKTTVDKIYEQIDADLKTAGVTAGNMNTEYLGMTDMGSRPFFARTYIYDACKPLINNQAILESNIDDEKTTLEQEIAIKKDADIWSNENSSNLTIGGNP